MQVQSGVYLASNGTLTLIADISNYVLSNPPAACTGGCACVDSCTGCDGETCAQSFDAGGTDPFDMIEYKGKLYVTDGNRDLVYQVDPFTKQISTFSDLSCQLGGGLTNGRVVTTGIAVGPDAFYVASFGQAQLGEGPGGTQIYKIPLNGGPATPLPNVHTTMGTGIAVADDGTIYVAEFARNFDTGYFAPGIPNLPFEGPGRIVKVLPDGSLETVMDGLYQPTMMRWVCGNLYATNYSALYAAEPILFLATGGLGQILKVDLHD